MESLGILRQARNIDAKVKSENVISCVDYMNKMYRKMGFIWCATKLPKRLPNIYVYDKEKKSILLTEEASQGKWYINKKGKAAIR